MNIIVPRKIESLNKFVRAHFLVYSKYKTAWHWELRSMLMPKCNRDRRKTRIKIVIVSYRTKVLDNDNLIGGCKAILDALVKLNWLYDDSPEYVTVQYKQFIDKENPRTEIEVME